MIDLVPLVRLEYAHETNQWGNQKPGNFQTQNLMWSHEWTARRGNSVHGMSVSVCVECKCQQFMEDIRVPCRQHMVHESV